MSCDYINPTVTNIDNHYHRYICATCLLQAAVATVTEVATVQVEVAVLLCHHVGIPMTKIKRILVSIDDAMVVSVCVCVAVYNVCNVFVMGLL